MKTVSVLFVERNRIMLTKRRDTYVVDTEEEAKKLVEEAKASMDYELTKHSTQKKLVKKTEEEYYVVVLDKEYGVE